MNKRPWILLVPLSIFLVACGDRAPADAAPAPERLEKAFDFELEDVNPRSATHGRRLSLGELSRERGLVLQFIASWCEPCREELPDLEKLHASGRIPVACVAADEGDVAGTQDIVAVAARVPLTMPLLYVPPAELARFEEHYGYEILPSTYLIDREGRIQKLLQGALPADRLAGEIRRALGG